MSSLIFTTNPYNGSATWPWANSILKARKRRERMTLTSAKEKLYPGHFLFPANPKGSKENGGNFASFSRLNRSGSNLFKCQVQTIINLKKLQFLCIFLTMDKQASVAVTLAKGAHRTNRHSPHHRRYTSPHCCHQLLKSSARTESTCISH